MITSFMHIHCGSPQFHKVKMLCEQLFRIFKLRSSFTRIFKKFNHLDCVLSNDDLMKFEYSNE